MPIEILETIANINYNTPRPRFIEPAVFFDLIKIRRLVDQATDLAVRAASDIPVAKLTSVHGNRNGHTVDDLGLGMGSGGGGAHSAKLSRERKFRMREQATQKLSRAYHLDEIASSVAVMQGTSSLEDVGQLVLQRNPDDVDAKYVHFFHEKIPSRQLSQCTSTKPLTDILSARPTESEVLRTRAAVKYYKGDPDGAAQDLSLALQLLRIHQPAHKSPKPQDAQLEVYKNGRRPPDIILSEEDQPSSLEAQLLFQRAGVYLTLACNQLPDAIPEPSPRSPQDAGKPRNESATIAEAHGLEKALETQSGTSAAASNETLQNGVSQKQLEARKMAKTYAKRALRDYMAFLSQFDYTPNLPFKITKDFTERVRLASQGQRQPRTADTGIASPHTVYSVSDLFTAVPPADLPPYPSEDVVLHGVNGSVPDLSEVPTNESVTYHPLLTDVLHSLLLCHCLVQTSAKELLRHAYMVARLTRLADGYPIFQSSRSPARADWIEVVRKGDSWIHLVTTWESLCAPAPLQTFESSQMLNGQPTSSGHPNPIKAVSAARGLLTGSSCRDENDDEGQQQQRRDRARQQAVIEALEDERVHDEETFRAAIRAREKRAEEEFSLQQPGSYGAQPQPTALRRWSGDDGREYPILTERAANIARWVKDVPQVTLGKKKKKPAGKKEKYGKFDEDVGGPL
jgi:hypothetical protein